MKKFLTNNFKKSSTIKLFRLVFLFLISINFQNANALCLQDTEAPLPDNPNLPTITGECSVLLSRPTAYDLFENKVISGTVVANKLTYSVGTYTVTWTYTDGSGNSISQDQKVIVSALSPPVISSNKSTNICTGDSVALSWMEPELSLHPIVYTGLVWTSSTSTYTVSPINVKTSDTYTLTVTSDGGCSSFSTVKVVVADSAPVTPLITSKTSTTFCKGGFVILKSNSSTGNTWSTGGTADSIKVDTSGTFYVTVRNGCGASRSLTKNVVAKPLTASITVTDPTSVCPGTSVTLVSTSPLGNSWSGVTGSNTNDSLTVNPTATKTYTLTLSNGCGPATKATKKITVLPKPAKPTLMPGTVCGGTGLGGGLGGLGGGGLGGLGGGGLGGLTGTPLTGGSPSGGTYSGTGIVGNNFSPLVFSLLGGGAPFVQVTYTVTDSITGCTNTTTSVFFVDTSSSCNQLTEIVENNATMIATIYPNPTSELVNVSIKNSSANQLLITITDLIGTVIYSATDKKSTSDYNKQINLNGLASGIYTIRLTVGSEVISQKLVVQ
jgi:Secretion system C-terminal sorting domain